MSDILEKIIKDQTILSYNYETKRFDNQNFINIINNIREDATVRADTEAADKHLREHKLNKPKLWELAGHYGRKGGKRSKNNKKKSKRKHQNNKKSHKKRR